MISASEETFNRQAIYDTDAWSFPQVFNPHLGRFLVFLAKTYRSTGNLWGQLNSMLGSEVVVWGRGGKMQIAKVTSPLGLLCHSVQGLLDKPVLSADVLIKRNERCFLESPSLFLVKFSFYFPLWSILVINFQESVVKWKLMIKVTTNGESTRLNSNHTPWQGNDSIAKQL